MSLIVGAREGGKKSLEVWEFLGGYKKAIGLATIFSGVLATFIVMMMRNEYSTSTTILPEQQVQLAQTVLTGGALQDAIIHRFDLVRYYGVDSPVEARERLTRDLRIKSNKDGSVTIEISNADPVQAAVIANAYPDEYIKLVTSLRLSVTAKARAKLDAYRAALNGQLEQYSKESQKAASGLSMASLANAKDSLRRLAALRAQLDSFWLEAGADKATKGQEWWSQRLNSTLEESDLAVSAKRYTEHERNYLELYSRTSYLEASLEMLKMQEKLLSAEEAANATRVLDPAVIPEKPAKPKRILIVAMVMLATALLLSLAVLFRDWLQTVRDPQLQDGGML